MGPGQQFGACFVFVDGLDPGAARPAAAGLHDRPHRLGRTGKHRLDRAVAAIAHPARDPMDRRRVLDEHAEADALHLPTHAHVTNGLAHPISPVATVNAPRRPEQMRRLSDCTYRSGRFHSRAAATTSSWYPGCGRPATRPGATYTSAERRRPSVTTGNIRRT